jgi:hypothetical protein
MNREVDMGCPPHTGAALKAAPPFWRAGTLREVLSKRKLMIAPDAHNPQRSMLYKVGESTIRR